MSNMSAAFEKGMNGLLKDHSVALTKELAKVFGFDVKEALQLVDTFLQNDKKEVKKKVVRKEKAVETEEQKKLIEEKADEVMKVMGLSKKEETAEKKKVVRKGKAKDVVVNLSPILEEEPVNEEIEEEIFMKDIDGKHYFVNESNGNIHEVVGDCDAGEVVGVYKDGAPVFNKVEEVPKKKSAAKKVEKKEEEKADEKVEKKAGKKKGKKVEKKA